MIILGISGALIIGYAFFVIFAVANWSKRRKHKMNIEYKYWLRWNIVKNNESY